MRFLIRNASVYLHGEGVRPRSILVEGKRIVRVSEGDIEASAMPIDLAGYTVMPGFINTHVHLMDCYNGFDTGRLRKWLNAGITHLRDQGILSYHTTVDAVQWKRDCANDCTVPSLSVCGKFLSTQNGYGGADPIALHSEEDAKDAVKRLADTGVDHIKIPYDEGYDPYTQSLDLLSEPMLAAIYGEANRQNLRVSAHVLRMQRLKTLLRTGIDEAAHVPMDALDDDTIRDMVRNRVAMTPTLSTYGMLHAEFGAPMIHQAMDNVLRFVRQGGIIGFGDDFVEEKSVWGTVGMPYMEIELLQKAGLTMTEIIDAATFGGAAVMGRDDLGRICEGSVADLIAVKGDPLAFPYLLSNVQFVMKNGIAVKQ